jgi:4-hydroxy-tetrahydrodipicolinate reductase
VTDDLPDTPLDAMIDFSTPAGTMAILPACVDRRIPLILATTGHPPEDRAAISKAALETPVLYVPNTSLAVNVLMILVRRAAELFRGRDFDVEILERHHRFKKDAPSGTALHLAKIIQEELGEMELRHGREGLRGERSAGEIGIHAIRVGDNVGEHTVIFSTLGETLELSHRAHARDCYARGAIQAAKYIAGKPPGRYTMEDVLGLNG